LRHKSHLRKEVAECCVSLLGHNAVTYRLELLGPGVPLRRDQVRDVGNPAIRETHQPLSEPSREASPAPRTKLGRDGGLAANQGFLPSNGRLVRHPVLGQVIAFWCRNELADLIITRRPMPPLFALVRVLGCSVPP